MSHRSILPLLALALAVGPRSPAAAQEPAAVRAELDDLKRRTATLEGQLRDATQAEPSRETRFEEMVRSSKDGFVRTSLDGNSTVRFGGRGQLDAGWYAVPSPGKDGFSAPFEDGVVIRRATLESDGTLWKRFDYSLHADVSRTSDLRSTKDTPDAPVYITNAWVGVTDLFFPGTVRVGHQNQPLLFSAADSSRYIPFMERPAVYDGLNDDFSYETGVSYRYSAWDDRVTGFVGLFKPGSRLGAGTGDGEYAVTGRLHAFSLDDAANQRWLYVGVAGSYRTLVDDKNRAFARPLVRTGTRFQVPFLIDTGDTFSESANRLAGAGGYAAFGPLAFGAEYLASFQGDAFANGLPGVAGSRPLGNLFLSGFYVEASYFLTPGDHHPVSKVGGEFARVNPVSPVGMGHGCGAWEIGLRYDRFDANTGATPYGRMDSVTAGVNWYLNANVRWMANCVFTQAEGGPAGTVPIHALGTRVAFDF